MTFLWKHLPSYNKKQYIKYLKIFGALSGLFKDNRSGANADKPYLYYRNHEQLFAKVFDVEDLTRKDSAFDVIATLDGERIGIGLKTWIHTRDLTYQKVAEFNKLAPLEFAPLIENKKYEKLIYKVAEFRNERIKLDKRQYNTALNIYHNITRDDHVMNIMESDYDLVQLDSLKLTNRTKSTYRFTDGLNNYRFYTSKSVLLKEFNASQDRVIERVPIKQFDDPFELLEMIELPKIERDRLKEVIYLPIYSDRTMTVGEKSGFNAWNGASKTKGSGILRPEFEAYIPVPVWIHQAFPYFFGFNALDEKERAASGSFNLHLPDGRVMKAIVTQDNGKSLQTNPQRELGKWILHDVLGLEARELLTINHLMKLGVDSLKITKIDDNNFKIELAETYAFERWKIDISEKIEKQVKRMPILRPELLEEDE